MSMKITPREEDYELTQLYHSSERNSLWSKLPDFATETVPFRARDARRSTLASKISNITVRDRMNSAKKKLRGVIALSKYLREISLYGHSTILLGNSFYRPRLADVIHKNRRQVKYKTLKDEKQKRYLFYPNSLFFQLWNLLMFLLIFYVFTVTPWALAFEDLDASSPYFYIELGVDILFFFDILVTMNSAYFEEDELVTSRRRIFKNYLTGLLVLDVLSIFPFYLFEQNDRSESNTLVRMVRILKLFKIFRASRMMKIVKNILRHSKMEKLVRSLRRFDFLIRLLNGMFFICIMAHFTACIWYYTARIDNFEPDTWVFRHGVLDESKGVLYLTSLYWAVTILTTVGFGDITARTSTEMVVCIIWMIIGILVYSFLVGTIASVLSSIDNKNSVIKERILQIEQLGEQLNFPEEIIYDMSKRATKSYNISKMNEQKRIETLFYLPKETRMKVCKMMNNNAADKIDFFKKKDAAFISSVVPRLHYHEFQPERLIYTTDEYAEFIYFICAGRVNYIIQHEDISFKSILTGGYFGEYELIHDTLRLFPVIAETKTCVLTMSRYVYYQMKGEFPKITNDFEQQSEYRHVHDLEAKEAFDYLLHVVYVRQETARSLEMRSSPVINKGKNPRNKSQTNKFFSLPKLETLEAVNEESDFSELRHKLHDLQILLDRMNL